MAGQLSLKEGSQGGLGAAAGPVGLAGGPLGAGGVPSTAGGPLGVAGSICIPSHNKASRRSSGHQTLQHLQSTTLHQTVAQGPCCIAMCKMKLL